MTIKLDQSLLDKVDDRAKALDLNRSQYFRRLARHDLESSGDKLSAAQAMEAA